MKDRPMRFNIPQRLARWAEEALFPVQYTLFWVVAIVDLLAVGIIPLLVPAYDLVPDMLDLRTVLKLVFGAGVMCYIAWCSYVFLHEDRYRDFLPGLALPLLGGALGWWWMPVTVYTGLLLWTALRYLALHRTYDDA